MIECVDVEIAQTNCCCAVIFFYCAMTKVKGDSDSERSGRFEGGVSGLRQRRKMQLSDSLLIPVLFILLFMTPVHAYRPDGLEKCALKC